MYIWNCLHVFRKQLRKKISKDKPILSAAEMNARDSSFWQYMVYADIREIFWRRGVKRHCVVLNGDFFSAFGVYIFGSFRNKANIILQYYLIPHWLSTDPKQMSLRDLEWQFYVCESFCTFCGRIALFLLCHVPYSLCNLSS